MTGIDYNAIDEKQWAVITTVYNFHPMIKDVGGKDQMLELWKTGGYGLIEDMHGTAAHIETATTAIQYAEVAIEKNELERKKRLAEVNVEFDETLTAATTRRNEAHKLIRELEMRYPS